MLSMGRIAAALIAGLVLVGSAHAQGVNPNSSQNVTPAAAPAGSATIEARRKALFARMLADPSNLDVAFEYAALSQQAGDLEAAISTLERMLIFAPGLPRLQFELGVLYYRLGAYETAGTYFRAVEAAEDVPPDVASLVALYLSGVERGASGNQFRASVTTGLRYQSNANAGPANPTITLNGLPPLQLNAGALSQPDVNAFVSGSLSSSIDLESQGDTFDVSLQGFASLYRALGMLNAGIVELRAGPTFNLGRFSIDNASLGFYGIGGAAMLGGSLYLANGGAGAALEFVLDARTEVTLRGEAAYDSYFNSAMRPTAALRSGMHYSAEAGIDYRLTPEVELFLKARFDRRGARRGYLSTMQIGGEAGVAFMFDSPVEALDGAWRISVSGGARHLVADAPDPVFSATTPEQTSQVFVQGSLTVPLPNSFAYQLGASFTQSMSNYPFGRYRNFAVSTALTKGF